MAGIVVLISGRGSNLAAMCKAGLTSQIKCVISNKADAKGLDIARELNIPSIVIDHSKFQNREEFDRQLALEIDKYNPKYIILAGFMRILSSWFVKYYTMRLVNIHPSVLPAFIGSKAIADAFNSQVKISGATIHFVTEQLDHGPIIAQGVISATECGTIEELADKIHQLEHVLYPFIINKLINNKVKFHTNSSVIVEKETPDTQVLGEFVNQIFY